MLHKMRSVFNGGVHFIGLNTKLIDKEYITTRINTYKVKNTQIFTKNTRKIHALFYSKKTIGTKLHQD